MNILFTICGRAGSKGFKNKNLKEMRDVPLVYYTVAVIKGYMKNNPQDVVTVAVNTDSENLVDILKKQDDVSIIYVDRNPELAGDSTPKVDVIKVTYETFLDKGAEFDVVIDLDITSPLRRVVDVENILTEYKSGKYDLVFSVVEARRSPYFNMVEEKKDGFYRKICSSGYTARQQAPKSYELNASIYAYSPDFLKSDIQKTILDYNCGISVMPDYLVLDIDSEEDFQMMQYLHEFYCNTDQGLEYVFRQAEKLI